jgi:hypothetical protein
MCGKTLCIDTNRTFKTRINIVVIRLSHNYQTRALIAAVEADRKEELSSNERG